MTNTPHDALFKAAFEAPAHAGALCRCVLPPPIVDAIDWTTMSPEPGSYITPELGNRHSDLLFSVQLGPARVLLYLLLEHQSSNDDAMPLRMLDYVGRISKRFHKEQGLPLPIVLPIVMSHAPEGWTAPTCFEALVDPHPATFPELVEVVPRFSFWMEDLSCVDNEDLHSRALAAFPKLALWALRDARDATTLLANICHFVDTLDEALRAPSGFEAVQQVFRYIALVCGNVNFEEFRDRIHAALPTAEEVTMTIAEELIQRGREQGLEQGIEQGLEQGIEQGRLQGQQRMLSNLLALKFGTIPAEHAERIAAATLEDLERYSARILTATTLAEVFAKSE